MAKNPHKKRANAISAQREKREWMQKGDELSSLFPHLVHFIEVCPNEEESYPLIQQATKSANAGKRKWSCLLLGRRRKQEDEPFLVGAWTMMWLRFAKVRWLVSLCSRSATLWGICFLSSSR